MKHKKNNKLVKTIFIFCLLVIYIIPISRNMKLNISEHGDIFYYARFIFIAILFLCILKLFNRPKKLFIYYTIMVLLIIISYCIYKEIPWTSILILAYIFIYDSIFYNINEIEISNKFLIFTLLCYIAQMVIMKITNKNTIGLISTCKDSNYTGYFLILLYFLFDDNGKKIQYRDIILLLAFCTFSRVAMISVIIIMVLKFLPKIKNIIIKNPLLIYYVFFVIWIIISFYFTNFFEKINYVYSQRTGIARLLSFIDYSNYIRTAINVKLINNLSIQSIAIGYNSNLYNSIVFFTGKIAHPHNLLLSIYAESGLIFSLLLVHRTMKNFKDKKNVFLIYVIILFYSMVLGPSMYYGIDTLLILFILLKKEKKNEQES